MSGCRPAAYESVSGEQRFHAMNPRLDGPRYNPVKPFDNVQVPTPATNKSIAPSRRDSGDTAPLSNRLTTCQDPPEIDVRRGRMGRSRSAGAGADRRSNQAAGQIPISPCPESSQFWRYGALVKRFDSANVHALSSRALYEHSLSAGLCAGRDLSTSSACNRRFQAMNHRELCGLDGLSNRLTTRLAPSK